MLRKLLLLHLIVVAAICFLGCNAPTKPEAKPEATYPCSFDFVGDFNNSRTILRLKDTTIIDSSLTYHYILDYPRAALIDILLKSGSHQMHVQIEGIGKDTVLVVNDTLYTQISFIKDSSKINITTSKYGPIIM
jgi:hypothetical protein